MKKTVIVIDDSALMRQMLTDIINSLSDFEVIDTANDPHIGAQKIMTKNPDIITLDIEMPKMDGLTFLEKLMRLRPIPVLIISSLSEKNSQVALKALELGAVDYITKPTKSIKETMVDLKEEIQRKLEMCSVCNVSRLTVSKVEVEKKYSMDAVLPKARAKLEFDTTDKVIAIGASTGGTVALSNLLKDLPTNLPGIIVVQHMPAGFTKSFADRLNNECKLFVKEAEENDTILPGQVLIAPGGKHLVVNRSGARFFVNILDGKPVNRHMPSVDVLFRSVASKIGRNAIGIILTGMGDDGAKGMLEMKEAGSFNMAQDEATSVVFGMPKVAIELGGTDKILALQKIADHLLKYKI